jgi:curved DNA-binding protein CbpA
MKYNDLYIQNKNLNFYEILQVEKTATAEDIRKSYKKLSLIYHPDKQLNKLLSNEEKTMNFIKIRNAYEILSDEKKRTEYDNKIFNKKNKIINDLNNLLKSDEYIIFMNILDNKIKQSFINNIFTEELLLKINQINLVDILQIINNLKILDITIKIDFTLCELFNNTSKIIKYNRITKSFFEEIIYPVDFTQTYENEGENITINDKYYCGNFIIKINIINNFYNNINYHILNNDLYMYLPKNIFVSDDILSFKYLDNIIYNFDLTKLNKIQTDFGLLHCINNFGIPYYNTDNDIINIQECEIIRGNLFFLLI